MQGNVLAYEYTDADTTKVEAIQELMDLRKLRQACPVRQLPFQVRHTHGHHGHDIAAMHTPLSTSVADRAHAL
jgi:hypothetical protein